MAVRDNDQGYNRILRELARLVKNPGVTVGIHADEGAKPYQRGQSEPVTTAMIGTFHEFGTLDRYEDDSPAGDGSGKQGVPRHSFLRDTVDQNKTEIAGDISTQVGLVIDGKVTIEKGLGRVGAKVVGLIQKRISQGIEPALTHAGIRSKIKPSSKPLVDTGQLRQAIDYVVET